MRANQRDFASKAPQLARQCRIFYFCGQDESGAAMALDRIASLLDNPGERIELSGADLRKDPVRLGDEARSISLFGDTRHIVVQASGDDAHDAVKVLLEGEGEACPVLILATSATDKSRIAKLLADRPDALVANFYPPDLPAVAGMVRQMGDGAGVRLAGDMAERIARACGLDLRLAQSEITKLALYLDASPQSPRPADAEAWAAIGARTEEDGFMSIVNVVLSGQAPRLASELKRFHDVSLNAVALLLAFERRVAQLAQLSAKLGPSGDIDGLLKAESTARRVFFKDVPDLASQLRKWRGRRLERLVDKLTGLHRALMVNNQSAELLLSQGLAEITRAASSRS